MAQTVSPRRKQKQNKNTRLNCFVYKSPMRARGPRNPRLIW